MCFRLPEQSRAFFQPEFWSGSAAPVALVAISVWLNLRPAKSKHSTTLYHLGALVIQLGLLHRSNFYDWGAGPIALILLLGGLWRARPEPLQNPGPPGLTRVAG